MQIMDRLLNCLAVPGKVGVVPTLVGSGQSQSPFNVCHYLHAGDVTH